MIIPVLLAGGSGTRLWPVSRQSYPKQFARLAGDRSLLQATAERLSGEGFGRPVIVTGEDYRFIATGQLAEIGLEPATTLIEPAARNTAPAALAAALAIAETSPEALVLLAPSDHLIRDTAGFRAAIEAARPAAEAGALVTFGVTPDRPETGYGYLELAGPDDGQGGAVPLAGFVEKPDAARAAEMVAGGRHLWNAGIFLFSVRAILDAFETHAPDIVGPARDAVAGATKDLDFLRLDPKAWASLPDISIDYAVMEKASGLQVVPLASDWTDLGGWEAIWQSAARDADGVATEGPATAIDCSDTLLHAEDDRQALVGIGLKDIVAVATPDAVLVADRRRAQDVKAAVAALKSGGVAQATAFPRDQRPWGWFETLALGERFQVKRIVVKPGGRLSLQSHVHRAEHWVVVSGTAKVTLGDEEKLLSENESVYVPLGVVHRLENPGRLPMVLIEVQTGSYLGEDDIVRYEDDYRRG
jgi:mannose-1-phosphate guanylyltransferase/mannose-6-phosphate isomerase